jgi:hypothetical protein
VERTETEVVGVRGYIEALTRLQCAKARVETPGLAGLGPARGPMRTDGRLYVNVDELR